MDGAIHNIIELCTDTAILHNYYPTRTCAAKSYVIVMVSIYTFGFLILAFEITEDFQSLWNIASIIFRLSFWPCSSYYRNIKGRQCMVKCSMNILLLNQSLKETICTLQLRVPCHLLFENLGKIPSAIKTENSEATHLSTQIGIPAWIV